MSSATPPDLQELDYEYWAQRYLRSLPPEHFMEAAAQGTQRKITLESLDLLSAHRPEVKVFNELLVQYPLPGRRRPGQVVPDNMVVLSDQPIEAKASFDIAVEPDRPFWMLEYVSSHNQRKDYVDSYDKYERDLKTPYYLIFYPEAQQLTLYRHTGEKYAALPANERGRYPIPELELEVGLLDEWVRFWSRGQLLPLPADLQRNLDEARRQTEQEKQRAEQEKQRADEAVRLANQEKQRADDLLRQAEQAEAARQAAEREVAELRARLEQMKGPTRPNS
jgi:Uma2 family endonuclease